MARTSSSRHVTQSTGAAHDTGRGGAASESHPGLVLLYAAAHARMAPAYPFRRDTLVLGRDDDTDIPVRDTAVSRRHATFVREAGTFTIADMGSRNGLWVDGVKVTRAVLAHGSRIRIGDVLFTFVSADADLHLPYAIDGVVHGVPPDGVNELVGGFRMRHLAREVARVAPTPLTCLVVGETGTGKELVARALHRLSGRTGPLVAVNCAAIAPTLFESELFGYKRGAFSGAERDKTGLVQAAHGGTLFLDELGELPVDMQAKLLRVLQSREVLPVGASRAETVDVRVVAATHRDLVAMARAGKFRDDLLARVDELRLVIPPLRARKEDIYSLTSTFLRRHATRPLALPFDVIDALVAYDWPYNVRELESSIKRAAALAPEGVLVRSDLAPAVLGKDAGPSAGARPPEGATRAAGGEDEEDDGFHRGAPKEAHLRKLLADHGGNIAAVARVLGKRRMQVQRTMQKYGIAPSEYRSSPAADDVDDDT